MSAAVLYRLWGKTNERARGEHAEKKVGWRTHPAVCHLLDVGYVAEAWLKAAPSLLARFVRLVGGELEPEPTHRLLATLTALHDLGKVHVRFQAKSEEGWRRSYGGARPVGFAGFDHGLATAAAVEELVRYHGRERWRPYRPAFCAAAAHHGSLYDVKEAVRDYMSRNALTRDDRAAAEAALVLVADLFALPDEPPEESAFRDPGFFMLFAGFVSVCDWFGSQLSDEVMHNPAGPFVRRQMRAADDARAYLDALRESRWAEHVLRDAGLLPDLRREGVGSFGALYPHLADKLHPLQRQTDRLDFGAMPGPELVIVEAPMGQGKTEIALVLAAKAVEAGTADGVYLALPTRASADALLDRLVAFAKCLGQPGSPLAVGLAHADRGYTRAFQKLRRRAIRAREAVGRADDTHADDAAEAIAPDWLQGPKRVLLAPLGVGTVDQALLGAIEVRHAFVRLFALAGKVVVLDEVHAYDAYTGELLQHLLRWLHALGAKVVLLSATLPRKTRRELLNAFGVSPEEAATVEAAQPEDDPYPQLLHARDGRLPEPPSKLAEERVKEPVHLDFPEVGSGTDARKAAGVACALRLAGRGGCVAWIRNTVAEAQDAWRALREPCRGADITLVLLHSRFCRPDRHFIEKDLVERLGPPPRHGEPPPRKPRPEKLLVVSSQVLESSVDCDFDAMLSDLAPMDLLLQRAGRLWRHARPKAERQGHTRAELHVLMPTMEERADLRFGPSGKIYSPVWLVRTAALLHERKAEGGMWTFPGACRAEVARLYDQRADWTPPGVSEEAMTREKGGQRGNESKRKGTAERAQITLPKWPDDLPYMRADRRDGSRDDETPPSTRYEEVPTVTVVLCTRDGDGIWLLHAPERDDGRPGAPVSADRDPKSDAEIARAEDAVRRSSVSFPWVYGGAPPGPTWDKEPPFAAWWRERHRHSRALFLTLDAEGQATHPAFGARYVAPPAGPCEEGLVVSR